jgi:hypothetical protein
MAKLDQPDWTKSSFGQIGCENPQYFIGILVHFIDERGKIALGIEHDVLFVRCSPD